VTAERATVIAAALPPFVTRVGLFVNAAPVEVEAVLASVRLDLLQFHGDETEADCRRYGFRTSRREHAYGLGYGCSVARLPECERISAGRVPPALLAAVANVSTGRVSRLNVRSR